MVSFPFMYVFLFVNNVCEGRQKKRCAQTININKRAWTNDAEDNRPK